MQASAPIARPGSFFKSVGNDIRHLAPHDVLLIAAVMVSSWYASARLLQLAGA